MNSTSYNVFAFLVNSLLNPPVQSQKAALEQPKKVQLLNKPIELENAVRV